MIEYWDRRYVDGRGSGVGSRGDAADYKASIVNAFIDENNIRSVVDLGCGDGIVASKIVCENYVGYDVSSKAVELCRQLGLNAKPFTDEVSSAELHLSLDVLYHLIDQKEYYKHLDTLFNASKYVCIFSCNFDDEANDHIKPRNFTADVNVRFPEWSLIKHVDTINEWSEFFFYARKLHHE